MQETGLADRYEDIDEAALSRLVERFYGAVRRDPVLGPVFEAAVDDWPEHFERLTAFWSSVMLGAGRYHGRPMQTHLRLPIEPPMFDRWLALWREAAAELFAPAPAAELVERAERIGRSLRLGMFFRPEDEFRAEGSAPPRPR